jgi:small subunit ribosomal protein S6
MNNRYEGLLILNITGSEESAKEIVDRLEGEFKKEGAQIEQVQKMDRRNFTYAAGPLSSGYYVNFIFHSEPAAIERLKAKFRLDGDVYRQQYLKVGPKIERAPRQPRPEKAE